MRTLLAGVLLALATAATLHAQETNNVTPNLTMGNYSSDLASFCRAWLQVSRIIPASTQAVEEMRREAATDPALATSPMTKNATFAILNELLSVAEMRARTERDLHNLPDTPKPALYAGDEYQWRREEKVRLAKNMDSRLNSAEKTVKNNLDIIDRLAASPVAAKFSMVAASPLPTTMSAGTKELRALLEKAEYLASCDSIHVEIVQVLDSGCLALTPSGQYDYKRIYVDGMAGGDFAEGQKFQILAKRNGVYKYGTVQGAKSTVEKWVFVAAE